MSNLIAEALAQPAPGAALSRHESKVKSEAPRDVRRPPMTRQLYTPSVLMTCLYIGHGTVLFFGGALGLYAVICSELPLWLAILLGSIAASLSGIGAFVLGLVGHDGTHLSLHKNKYTSALLGIFFSAAVPTYFEMGFAVQHWNHHRYCNQADDPDIQTLARLRTWWQRFLCARLVYNWTYAKTFFRMLAGRDLNFKYKMPFTPAGLRTLAWANLISSLLWLTLYAALAHHDRLLAVSILVPVLVGLVLSSAQSYLDHAGTPSDRRWQNTRTRTSWLATAIWCGNNYHLEHHLYPGIPGYWLPRVHRALKAHGIYSRVNAVVDDSFWRPYMNLAAPYRPFTTEDADFDPHPPELRGRPG